MNSRQTPQYASSSGIQTHHLTDYLRVIYKRRWTAALALVAVFVYSAMGILKQTPIYEASSRLLIDKDVRRQTTLNAVGTDQQSYYDDDFYPTQFKILQSRRLAWRAIKALGMNRPADGASGPACCRQEPLELLELFPPPHRNFELGVL